MNHVERVIASARAILAEEAELESQFPWLLERADREGFSSFEKLPPLDELDGGIYERYVDIRVQAHLASETLKVWGVSI